MRPTPPIIALEKNYSVLLEKEKKLYPILGLYRFSQTYSTYSNPALTLVIKALLGAAQSCSQSLVEAPVSNEAGRTSSSGEHSRHVSR